jgi:amidophosphoribosyltransferase
MSTLNKDLRRRHDDELHVTTALGHGRYETSGADEDPFRCQQPFSFCAAGIDWSFAFNGTIANYDQLKDKMRIRRPDVDTEAVKRSLRQEINKRVDLLKKNAREAMRQVFEAMEKVLDGGYNIVLINNKDQLFAYRDAGGVHPLSVARTKDGSDIVTSEDSAMKRVFPENDVEDIRYLGGGEMFASSKEWSEILRVKDPELHRCFFEWVYFARDLSRLDDVGVRNVREAFGRQMAREELERGAANKGRISRRAIGVGVPKSALEAAATFAEEMGIENVSALQRRPGAGRSFMQKLQRLRAKVAQEKFEIHPELIEGKDVFLTEDSLVRGTTMKKLVKKLHDAGARSIHLRIACPPIIAPCFYGIDFATIKELLLGKYRDAIIANGGDLTPEIEVKIAEVLGVDSVRFLSREGMLKVFEECGIPRATLCTACIQGTEEGYPTAAGQRLFQIEDAKVRRNGK